MREGAATKKKRDGAETDGETGQQQWSGSVSETLIEGGQPAIQKHC